MKKLFTKKLAVICLSAVMVLGLGVSVATLGKANAASQKIEIEQIEAQYALNSTLKVEDRILNVPIDGSYYALSEGTVTYPNGFIYKANNKVGHVLDQIGQYTVAYKLVNSVGKTITVYDTFDVKSEYFYLSTDNGSTVRASSQEALGSNLEGISVNLNDGCEIKFSKPVDLNKEGLVDVISFDPEGYDHQALQDTGAFISNADYVTVTLTDAYDASIYMFYRVCVRTQSGYGYVRAGSNTQQDGGLQPTVNPEGRWDRIAVYIDGVSYLNYFAETLGTQSAGGAKNHTIYNLKYDYKNNYAYVNCGSGDRLIAQLQNPACYNAGVKMFPGFTTGEVFVSLKAENYTSPGYQVDIVSVGDLSGADIVANYNDEKWEENYKDERAPSIYYDLNKTDANAVYIAQGEDFVIPSAKVYDVNLATDISVNVYKDYYDVQQRTPITIKDGKFTVRDFETYTVEYSAKDYAGNVGIATFDVVPVDFTGVTSDKALYNIGTLSFATDKLSKIYSGNTVTLPEYTFTTCNLDSAKEVKIVATCNGKNYEIDPEVREFIPETTGLYQITYYLKDNATSKVLTYSVNCESNGIVRFVGKPFALRDYLAGFKYEIEPFNAYEYIDGPAVVSTDVYVQYDQAGEWTKITDLNNFTVSATASTVQFKYVSTKELPGGGKPEVLTDLATVRNVGSGSALNPLAYFYGEGFNAGTQGTNIVYDITSDGTKKLSFVNPIAIGDFTTEFNTLISKSDGTGSLERINVIFTDIYNTNNKAVFSIYEENGALYFTTNKSSNSVLCVGQMLGTANKSFNYNNLVKKAKYGSTVLDYDMDFTTGLAYLDIELVNAVGDVRIIPKKIANVSFNKNLTSDKKESSWFIPRDHGNRAINSEVTIYAPSVADVLTPSLYYNGYVKVSILDSDNEIPYGIDENGNRVLMDGKKNDPKKDYTLKLDKYTTYIVSVSVTDVSNENTGATTKTRTESYRIYVVNDQAPVITLGDGLSQETIMNVDLGKEFSIPYTVQDDNTELEDLSISVIIYSKKGGYCVYSKTPYDQIESTYELITDKCTLNRKGEYYVYIFAYDTSGNYAYDWFTVNVM